MRFIETNQSCSVIFEKKKFSLVNPLHYHFICGSSIVSELFKVFVMSGMLWQGTSVFPWEAFPHTYMYMYATWTFHVKVNQVKHFVCLFFLLKKRDVKQRFGWVVSFNAIPIPINFPIEGLLNVKLTKGNCLLWHDYL